MQQVHVNPEAEADVHIVCLQMCLAEKRVNNFFPTKRVTMIKEYSSFIKNISTFPLEAPW
jgi:hypothetical protein